MDREWLAGAGAGVLLPGWQGSLALANGNLIDATALPAPLNGLLQPLLADALMELQRRAGSALLYCCGRPIPVEQLLAILRLRLTGIVSLPLALACEDARAEAAADGVTDGFASRAWADCLAHFPLLRPLMRTAARGWIGATEAFLQRLDRDTARLAQWLGMASLPPIQALGGTGADPHDRGNTVLLVRFASGQEIYYKPRPVTGEFLWQALLEELARSTPGRSLPAARVLPGSVEGTAALAADTLASGYGWMEALSAEAVRRDDPYWHGAGGLLCLAQHFALTDLHIENVVPQETGPTVVDAECLGSAGFYGDAHTNRHDDGEDAIAYTVEQMLATGLLGSSSLEGRSEIEAPCALSELPDLSGLFARTALVPTLRLPYWETALQGPPQLALTLACLTVKHASAAQTTALAVLPHLREGYQAAARALLACRSGLLAKGGWVDVLERVHAPRVLVRTTLGYALALSRSLFPDHLRSRLDRRAAIRARLEESPHLLGTDALPAALAEAEIESLFHLDLPRFTLGHGALATLEPGSTSLSWAGMRSPASTVRRRLELLSEEGMEKICLPALTLACVMTRR